jgi:putative ABC transport system permease protein
MQTIGQDLRYGFRALWNSPGFAIVSTLTLALAIGVNTSIFSLVSVVVFADLPMQESETVHVVRGVNAELEIDQGSMSPADYLDLVERSRSFESLSALNEGQWVLTGLDRPLRVTGLRFTVGLIESWKLPPVLGRSFAEGEDRRGAEPVAMLTHGFWQDQYGGRTDVIGETINLDGQEHTIVGVTHPKLEFASFATAQVVTPLILNRGEPDRAGRSLFVSGRLAASVTDEMAAAEVRQIGVELAEEHPAQNRGWGLWSAPVMESLIDDDGKTIMLLLQLAVGMIILIACANVANMLLARSTARARELAVRSALGAGRARLLRQLLTESIVISLAAAGLGLAFAYALNESLIWISAGTEEVFLMARFDEKVLAFTLLVSLVAPLAFGLFPALRASSSGPSAVLRDGRSGDGGRSGKRARGALVSAQVALALTLMIVATLLTRTVINLQTRPLGFVADGLLTVQLDLPENRYEEPASRLQFFARARDEMSGVPGVGAVELTSVIPAAGSGSLRALSIEGLEAAEGRAAPTGLFVSVSAGYFDLIGLPILQGRAFTEADEPSSVKVAVLSKVIADRYWAGRDPVGRRVQIVGTQEWLQVIGVVGDVRSLTSTEQGAANIYVPHAQDARGSMYLVTRTTADPAGLAGTIREAIWRIDPNQPIDEIQTVQRAQYLSASSTFALLTLFVTFALFALFMAAIGIYGVMAYSVSQRRREIGLRMALGAEAGTVRLMVLSQGARLLAVGVAAGLLAGFAVSRLLGTLVFGISATDPLTFAGVPLVLAGVALVANLIPAWRATRLDPADTLRANC